MTAILEPANQLVYAPSLNESFAPTTWAGDFERDIVFAHEVQEYDERSRLAHECNFHPPGYVEPPGLSPEELLEDKRAYIQSHYWEYQAIATVRREFWSSPRGVVLRTRSTASALVRRAVRFRR